MTDLSVIKEDIDFQWDKYFTDEIWGSITVDCHYSCYNWQAIQSEKTSMAIRVFARMQLFNDGGLIFNGLIITDYHIVDNPNGVIAILKELFKRSHQSFVEEFDRREMGSFLYKFRPVFSEEVANATLQSLLHPRAWN